jgi:crossover junction endodeoxyribonuclease RuvC
VRVLGIDPGLSGAIAILDGDELVSVEDVPILEVAGKRHIDAYGLARIIDSYVAGEKALAWLEFVAASPQMGVTSAFRFGETYGLIRGVLAANFVRTETVPPRVWKKAMGVKADKDGCRMAAIKLFPRRSELFARKRDDGRAEAALIAAYGAGRA